MLPEMKNLLIQGLYGTALRQKDPIAFYAFRDEHEEYFDTI